MRWEPTDQFGNLYVCESQAQSVEELLPLLESLVREAASRAKGTLRITVDLGYGEINGPDPEQVSHVIQAPWLSEQTDAVFEPIADAVRKIAADQGIEVNVELA